MNAQPDHVTAEIMFAISMCMLAFTVFVGCIGVVLMTWVPPWKRGARE